MIIKKIRVKIKIKKNRGQLKFFLLEGLIVRKLNPT
jgi:hypothetical protein